jgi:hypothetical protein
MPIAAISIGRRAGIDSSSRTIFAPCSSASRSCGRLIARIRSPGRLQPQPDQGYLTPGLGSPNGRRSSGRDAGLDPPTVHNERSSCQDTVSLWAWWHLPGAFGLAPLSRYNTWQVVVQMTSNPKSVQNDQRSSPSFLAFWVREIVGRGTSTKIAAQKPSVNKQDDVLSPPRRCAGRSVSTRTVAKDINAEGRLYPLI